MGKLREFTVAQRRPDPCPHGCGSWAIEIGAEQPEDKDGHKHRPTCPAVANCCGYCGYCGNTQPRVEQEGGWPYCPECGGV